MRRWTAVAAVGLLGWLAGAPALAQAPDGKVGQHVQDELVEFTVRRVERHKALKLGPLSAAAQGEFIAILLRAENAANVGSRSVTPDTVVLLDGRGRRIPPAAEAVRVLTAMHPEEGAMFERARELWPSLRVDGWIAFDVPRDASGLRLLVKGVPSSKGKTIDLGSR
jgi:uncharacterized protein DUF4352